MAPSRKKHQYPYGKSPQSQTRSDASKADAVTANPSADNIPETLRLELLPIRPLPPHLLISNIDNVVEASYDRPSGRLRMKCHVVAAFDDAAIGGLQLQVSAPQDAAGGRLLGAIVFKAMQSPGVAASYPNLAWAAQSRLVVDVEMHVPGLTAGHILAVAAEMADAAGPARIFGRIHLVV